MIKKITKMLSVLSLTIIVSVSVYAETNPTKDQIWEEAVSCGMKYEVPPEIIFSIIAVESDFHQFYKGKPFVYKGTIGLMQVLPKYLDFKVSVTRLKTEWKYNMDVGTRILVTKWEQQNIKTSKSTRGMPVIGTGDRMVLESWYFAVWAYNHWGKFNNPNYRKSETYQDKVIRIARQKFGFEISKLDSELLPDASLPKPSTKYEYPSEVHYSVLKMFETDIDNLKNLNSILAYNESGNNGIITINDKEDE